MSECFHGFARYGWDTVRQCGIDCKPRGNTRKYPGETVQMSETSVAICQRRNAIGTAPDPESVCSAEMQILYNSDLRLLPECGSVFVEPPVLPGSFLAPLVTIVRLSFTWLEGSPYNL